MNRFFKNGYTLTELMVVAAAIGVIFMVTRAGMTVLNGLANQRAQMEVQREAQNVMYQIIRKARNAAEINYISSTTLRLQVFYTGGANFANLDLYNEVEIGTVTYHYQVEDDNTYLLMRREFPAPYNILQERRLLLNMVREPTVANPMFLKPPTMTNPPYPYVGISLRLSPSFLKKSETEEKAIEYTAFSMKRTRDEGGL